MPFNYAPKLALAQKLIKFYGRPVTLVQLNSTPTDPTKPWQGTANPRATPAATLVIYGVFVEPESLERLGKQRASSDFIKSAEQVLIVSTPENLGIYDEAIDEDGSTWKIDNLQSLQPGGITLLHYLRVQRRGKATAVRSALL